MSHPEPTTDGCAPDLPSRPGRGAAAWLLGAAVVATCLGMTAATYRGDGTSINAYLFMTAGLSHAAAGAVERLAMGAVLALALVALAWPRWPVLLPVAGYVLVEALAGRHEGGYRFSEWAPFAHAPRYLTPIAVILFVGTARCPDALRRRSAAAWVLRVGLATTFLVHGVQALQLHPAFVDLLISTAQNLAQARMSESQAVALLRVIGVVDLAVAAAVLVRLSPVVLAWAAFWGAVTAASRMTAYGWGACPELLVRSTHFLTPLALWLLARNRLDRHSP